MHFFHPQEAQVRKKRHTKLWKTNPPLTAVFLNWPTATVSVVPYTLKGSPYTELSPDLHPRHFWDRDIGKPQVCFLILPDEALWKKISQTYHKQREQKKHNWGRVYISYFSCPAICPAPPKERNQSSPARPWQMSLRKVTHSWQMLSYFLHREEIELCE